MQFGRRLIERIRYRTYNCLIEADIVSWAAVLKAILVGGLMSGDAKIRVYVRALSKRPIGLFRKYWIERVKRECAGGNVKSAGNGLVVLRYAIVIKPWVSDSELGVIVIAFENELEKLASANAFAQLTGRYHLIFIPSWTGFFSSGLVALAANATSHFFVMPVHRHEARYCQELSDKCFALPFNQAAWVRGTNFISEAVERDIGCLMVANFSTFKRHWLLFDILSKLPSSINAVCLGVPLDGRTKADVIREASLFGVAKRVEVIENPAQEVLRQAYRRAKVFCAMSFREGSYISVAESLLSGTPVVAFRNSHFGTKELLDPFNSDVVGTKKDFGRAVADRVLNGSDYQQIAKRIGPKVSAEPNAASLNRELRDHLITNSQTWSKDISGFYLERLRFHYLEPTPVAREFADDHKYLRSIGFVLENAP